MRAADGYRRRTDFPPILLANFAWRWQLRGCFLLSIFVAVAEVLAWVYRVNRYRYYAERN